jgi:aminopeptidase-like protein
MHGLIRDLYPLCRSITGDGVRKTLNKIKQLVPLTLNEVATGTRVLDWEVPKEWNIREARIETLSGRTIVDFADCNLHVVSYSTPVDRVVTHEELSEHVHTIPNRPDLVPYRTGYYAETWGFCLPHRVWQEMREPNYRVYINSTLTDGSLTYGELLVPGIESEEVLISVHCCHPSLANDNLSGVAVAAEIGRSIMRQENRLTYRLLFIPATIGSISWLARNEAVVPRIAHGLVLTCVGDRGIPHYKRSRRGDAVIDRTVAHVLACHNLPHEIMPFSPYGYDERQYCSPGYDMPVGCFMRSPNGTFPEYHTSADNLDFVKADALEESYRILIDVLDLLERNVVYSRVDGRGEPQLGRRGLYPAISGRTDVATTQMALLWVLNLADGRHSLLDMAEHSGLKFSQIAATADLASRAGLIRQTAQ